MKLQHELRDHLTGKKHPPSVIRLAEHLFTFPLVTASRAEKLLGVTRPTAHAAINALVRRGHLIEVTHRKRNRIYEAPRIYEAVYGPVEPREPPPSDKHRLLSSRGRWGIAHVHHLNGGIVNGRAGGI